MSLKVKLMLTRSLFGLHKGALSSSTQCFKKIRAIVYCTPKINSVFYRSIRESGSNKFDIVVTNV